MIELPVIDAAAAEAAQPDQRFWRSFRQLENDPAFRELARQEFQPGATDAPGGATRRQFLQLMGASVALAGLTACRRPEQKILPYTRKPEEIIPGVPLFYATAMPFRGTVRGLLVESHEGRPTKVEGNPEHPVAQGTTSAFEQASLLNLYDPDRSQFVLREGAQATWGDFLQFMNQFAVGASARRVVVLAEEDTSATVGMVRERLGQRFPQLQWITYAPEGDDPERQGMQMAFGRSLRPLYQFDRAQVIVSLDADFLGPTERNFIHNTRTYARSRRLEGPQEELNRLYVVESAFTITGGRADNRLRLRASDILLFAAALAARLGVETGGGAGPAVVPFADHPYVIEMAQDLRQAGQGGLVLAGATQPAFVHALCMAINGALGSIGTAVELLDTGEAPRLPQAEAMVRLVQDMRAGAVDALFMIGANPVYEAPAELNFAEAMQGVDVTVHLGLHVDETARLSHWHIPRAHYLEAWGDGRAYDGTYSIIQPLIAPLYEEAKSEIELLNVLATGLDQAGYDLVREAWRDRIAGPFEQGWRRLLHDGFQPDSGYPAVTAAAGAVDAGGLLVVPPEALEVVFRLDDTLLDGSYANNAWLQELPDPTTKIVWDNVAVMSPATADRLGLAVDYDAGKHYADLVRLSAGGHSIELPVWIVPGHPDNSVTLTFGYGRDIETVREPRRAWFFDTAHRTDVYGRGALANGVGTNVAPLRTPLMERVLVGAEVEKVGRKYMVVTTQEYGSMEGRPLFRMATLEHYRQDPTFAGRAVEPLLGGEPWEEYPELWRERHPADEPAFKDAPYFQNQWGMVIDLNTCTGCNACVTACDSENNIPVVGKDQVSRGREMHWLRVDRYFVSPVVEPVPGEGAVVEGDGGYEEEAYSNPQMVFQPLPCMHCENAPCEPVCPVAATSHSADGLNEMTYNRCIGTRYCSNNCPYKVRRFNFFNWTNTMPVQVQMAQNPNVTVRFRGVMEKCTYCVQRIREAHRRALVEDRRILDGEVVTACQQVCPADAIIFGDLNDPDSKVSRFKRDSRRYEMLAELNTKPRTSYLGQVRNPNPRLTPAVLRETT